MSRKCQLTQKGPKTGNNVSHAKNRTRRRFLPNIMKRRLWVPKWGRYVTLKLSASALRTIDKKGIDNVIDEMV